MTGPHDWLGTAQMAELMGVSQQGLNKNIKAWGWREPDKRCTASNPHGIWRTADQGGHEYHYSLLPARLQAVWQARMSGPVVDPTVTVKERKAAISREAAWEHYSRLPDTKKAEARRRLAVLDLVEALVAGGTGKDDACRIIGRQEGVSRATLFGWQRRLIGVTRADWLPFLVDHRGGARVRAEIPDEAWQAFLGLYLRPDGQPSIAECYNRVAEDLAPGKDWGKLPPVRTWARRVRAEIPAQVIKLNREGVKALDRTRPSQKRDTSVYHALEALNYDGHKLDLFVMWPGATEPARAFLIAFQDLFSGMFVGWRLDTAETAHSFRLAFGDVIETYGLPDVVYSDNTMAAAAKSNTAGAPYRHRYKPKADDPIGLFPLLGVDLRFTTPGHGQSKPIERAFGTLSRYISKAPECAGAYTGNRPDAKPENYRSKAVPLDKLLPVIEREVRRFNESVALHRKGNGLSRREVFAASYETAPIRKAVSLSLEQRLMWRLASDVLRCRKNDGSIEMYGNRYWSERLVPLAQLRVVVRYDPDRLHQAVHVYRLDGAYVGPAECQEAVGFDSKPAAKETAKAKSQYRRAARVLDAMHERLSLSQVVAMTQQQPDPPDLEARVVRPFRFAGSAAVALDLVPETITAPDQFHTAFAKGVAALRLVTDE